MNIYQGLLFLHGHILRPEDLEPTASTDTTVARPAAEPSREEIKTAPARQPDRTSSGSRARFGLLENILFLGGRPMHPDHAYDREEPFEQLVDSGEACTQ